MVCDVNIFFGRLSFVLTITEITSRQLIKYLYIFKWKSLVRLNDDFFALFVTIINLVLSIIFVFVAYFLGFHNEEPDYHICTGRMPSVNIGLTMKAMKHPNPMNVTSSTEWLKARLHLPFMHD